jgi:hypothetical protein
MSIKRRVDIQIEFGDNDEWLDVSRSEAHQMVEQAIRKNLEALIDIALSSGVCSDGDIHITWKEVSVEANTAFARLNSGFTRTLLSPVYCPYEHCDLHGQQLNGHTIWSGKAAGHLCPLCDTPVTHAR